VGAAEYARPNTGARITRGNSANGAPPIRAPEEFTVAKQKATIARQQTGMETVTARVNEHAAQIQKVSSRLEASKPAPQIVLASDSQGIIGPRAER